MRAVATLSLFALMSLSACSQVAGPDAAAAPAADAAPAATALVADPIAAALAGDWRSDKHRARDVYRHPHETLSFFGVAPGQTVIELWPGGGWYTEILAPIENGNGHYIAAAPTSGEDGGPAPNKALHALFDAHPAQFDHASIVDVNPAAPVLGAPGSADVVLTFRNVHNWVMAGQEKLMFQAVFDVLRPGGTFGVVDHRARAGAPPEEMKSSGYLPEDYVIGLAKAAGFELVAQSEINANPKDTKDYADGVWTLPPTLTKKDQDRDKYLAIGESDRMTLKFVKPAP